MESNGIFIPVFATFYIRDGKAARDMGNVAQKDRVLAKVDNDARLSDEQKFEVRWHIQNAKYTPNPTKPVYGCVSKGYGTRVYTGHKVESPAEQALAILKTVSASLDSETLAKYTSQVEAKFAAEEKAQVEKFVTERTNLLDSLLA